jgi:hypothetical protein
MQLSKAIFIDLLLEKLVKLAPHSYIADHQTKYFKNRKEKMQDNEFLVLMDFSENYGFQLQDESHH